MRIALITVVLLAVTVVPAVAQQNSRNDKSSKSLNDYDKEVLIRVVKSLKKENKRLKKRNDELADRIREQRKSILNLRKQLEDTNNDSGMQDGRREHRDQRQGRERQSRSGPAGFRMSPASEDTVLDRHRNSEQQRAGAKQNRNTARPRQTTRRVVPESELSDHVYQWVEVRVPSFPGDKRPWVPRRFRDGDSEYRWKLRRVPKWKLENGYQTYMRRYRQEHGHGPMFNFGDDE